MKYSFSLNADNQEWIWNETDGSIRSNDKNRCLTLQPSTETWAGPLSDGSKAVLLVNRNSARNRAITIRWSQLAWRDNQTARVRDLWARKDLGTFSDHYTSPGIGLHASQMLKITPIQ